MVSDKEQKCIKRAREIHLEMLRSSLKEIEGDEEKSITYQSAIIGVMRNEQLKNSVSGTIKKIFFLPIAILLEPIFYVMHLSRIKDKKSRLNYKKSQIEKEIGELEIDPISIDVPDIKTLEKLWELHGIKTHQYPDDIRINMLCDWLNILYGREMSEKLKIKERISRIERSQQKMRDIGRESRVFICFVPPIESLIIDICKDLPPYEKMI